MNRIKASDGPPSDALSVLVLGGYGLIGAAIMRRLSAAGHHVTGVGRSPEAARKTGFPDWHHFDIGTQTVEGWRGTLQGVDVVVNASGALQDGANDNLTAIHETALARLGEALAGTHTRLIQISAAGVSDTASTEFFRSKARGEAALRVANANIIILRPTLVIAPSAYGGTALLRAAAALPFVVPKVLPNANIQCVHIDDLTQAVLDATESRIAPGTEVDVTGPDALSLPDLIRQTRRWLGFPDCIAWLPAPRMLTSTLAKAADLAGHLGWRSPLRSTALRVLEDGIHGDPDTLSRAGGSPCRSLDAIFTDTPATLQDRWFARAYLMFPLALLTLALFWTLSGLIGLIRFPEATDVLTTRGLSTPFATTSVALGSLADIALGLAVLVRRWAKPALLGMIAVSLAYIAGATLFAPDLWLDPLGPMVKVLPGMTLALFTLALLDNR